MPVVIVLRVGILAVSQMQIWIRFVGASLRFTLPRCMRVRLGFMQRLLRCRRRSHVQVPFGGRAGRVRRRPTLLGRCGSGR